MKRKTIIGFCYCLIFLLACNPKNNHETADSQGWTKFTLLEGEKVDTLNWLKSSHFIDTAKFIDYHNPKYGFTIKVPQEWVLKTPDKTRILALTGPERDTKTKASFSVIVNTYSSKPQFLIDRIVMKIASNKNASQIGLENLIVNGLESKEYLFRTWIPNLQISGYMELYFIADRRNLFMIQGVTDSTYSDNDMKTFRAIVSSIQFIKK